MILDRSKRFINIFYALLLLSSTAYGQQTDYFQYHRSVIKAEEEIFVKEHIADGLKIYLDVFSKYDFVFLQDCVTAMQIALYANDEKTFLALVDKATQNGFKKKQLDYKDMNYIREHPLYLKNEEKVWAMYNKNRSHYLKRIDTAILKRITYLYAYDQLSKNHNKRGKHSETHHQHQLRYGSLIKKTIEELFAITKGNGFPSDKLIGVDQTDIMAELGFEGFDAIDYYNRNKDDILYNAAKGQFNFDQPHMASTHYFPLVIHNYTMHYEQHDKHAFLFHSDDFYLQQIKAGNMHPKELALLYDFPYRGIVPNPDPSKGEKFFRIGISFPGAHSDRENKHDGVADEEINKYRAPFYIAPIENDRAKYRFMRSKGMWIYWGWSGYRS